MKKAIWLGIAFLLLAAVIATMIRKPRNKRWLESSLWFQDRF
ncbi:hypothetical protein [Amycolatopsis anabasis]|nr:hypothetical protein [Amycolatopsis anabasis]